MQDQNILSIEFHKALKEEEKYRKFKIDVRNQVETKVGQITK